MQKIILSQPGQSHDDLVASNVGAILVGLLLIVAVAAFLPLIILVAIAGGGRRRCRRW